MSRFDFATQLKKKPDDEEAEAAKPSVRRVSLNLSSEVHSFSTSKTYWKSLDENMNSKSKMDFESNDGDENNEPTSANSEMKLETIIEASDSFSSEFLALQDKETTDEKSSEPRSLPMLADDSDLLDKDVDVHEEEVDGTMDEFETNESSIIKVDSSDESQTTIELMPASPDLSGELDVEVQKEDIEEEQIYTEDAVPMHFECELEVGESAVDPLEVPLPGLETEVDRSGSSSCENNQIPGILINEQLGTTLKIRFFSRFISFLFNIHYYV